jgi:hypothetical protein
MLGALRALLPGAAFAQTWPTLVSLWTFDETSAAGGVFADSGPANVPMTIVGTWADLSTPSMIQGVGGTSAYTNGSGHATIPADDPDHDLSELTISFYYQRNSAAAKHVLLVASDAQSTGVGDFSIEVLPNGMLRGFHVGQDAQLRFFESTDGITGTNLQVGTAHRIDVTFGPQGARIYLDGAPLTSAFILANTNGWNNARTKHLGRWIDGAGPAEGAFDGLRIWDRQLTSAQIAALEPAQSITLSQLEELSLQPSLAEWLTSDEADGTVTKFVSNANRGNGSGSSPQNAQEVQAALNGASGGQVLLAVCQTPGTIEHWTYASGLTFPNGTSHTNRVTLKAREGDGVVINAGGEFGGSRSPGTGFWTQSGLSADDINKKIWRSTATFTGGAQTMMGFWIEFDHPHQLISAGSMTNLRATYGTGSSPGNYSGPMVFKDSDNRVYIRFQRPHVGKYSAGSKWSATTTWPGFPEAVSSGQLVYPLSEDPNDYLIHLFRVSSINAAFKTGQWIKVGPGINSCGFREAVGASNTWIDRGTHLTWRFGVRPSESGNHLTNVYCNRARFSDGSKLHVSRGEWKFGGWLEGGFRSAWLLANASGSLSHIYCKDCTISDYHELFVSGWNNNGHIRWRNCTIARIYDDGIQALMSTTRVEVGYNFFYNAAYGGMGENVDELSDANPGGWFIHHNIMDARQERCTDWGTQAHPGALYIPHSPDDNRPVRQYNNLFIWGPDTENEFGIGMEHSSQGDGGNNTSTVMHECFNNILLRVFLEDTKRYDPDGGGGASAYSDSFAQDRSDFVLGTCTRYSASESNELFDYNCYWRPSSMSVDALLKGHRRGGIGQTRRDFDTLAAWKAHAEFEHSKLSGARRGAYAPGFDGNSTDGKPTLPSIDDYPNSRFNYRPAATSVVTTATASSLSGANWWSTPPTWGATYFPWNDGEKSLAPSPWKGALDPNGTTLPVGVQNP